MNMVEKVARAIAAELEKRGVIVVNYGDVLGRVAIEALREPTDGMLNAAYPVATDHRAAARQ